MATSPADKARRRKRFAQKAKAGQRRKYIMRRRTRERERER